MLLPPISDVSPAPGVIRVLMVDDHESIIELMAPLVDSVPGFKVVGTALDGTAALTICREQTIDLVILDLVLPDISGLSLLLELKMLQPPPKVLIFTGSLNPPAMRGALDAGVAGVVEKMAPLKIFREALQAVAAGETYFGPLAGDLIKNLVLRPEISGSGPCELTPREKTVLAYVSRGMSSQQIADRLGLSVHTVVNHRSNLMKKTGLRRVAQLSLFAAQTGLVGETTLQ